MKKEEAYILSIIQDLSRKSYGDMTKEEKEWNDPCTFIVPYIVQKYKLFPEIRHNPDDKNSKDCKLTDFEFITKGIDEIPEGHYEHALICGKWDDDTQKFLNPSKQELIEKMNSGYKQKNDKNYNALNSLKGLIFSGVRVSSKFQPLDILKNFRAQQGNFGIIIFVGFRNENNTFLLIYQKELDIGYEIHLESLSNKFIIHKDIKVNFLTNTFYDRILKK